MGVVFEEGEVPGLVEEDDDRSSVVEVVVVVVVVVFFLPSPSLLLVSFLAVLLDCIGTTEGLIVFCRILFYCFRNMGDICSIYEDTSFQ